MKGYLRWGFEQIYLLFFWPTRYAELTKEIYKGRLLFKSGIPRLHYLLQLLPFTSTLQVLGVCLLGLALATLGVDFNWIKFREQLPVILAISVVVGMAAGIGGGVAAGVGSGVAFGVGFGMATGIGTGMAFDVVTGVAYGGAGGVAFGLAVGVASVGAVGVTFGVTVGVAFGVVFSVAGGEVFGVAGGVTFPIWFWLIYFRVPWFLVDAGLARLAHLRLGIGGSARALWRWHPLRWNEVIWLPLDGAGAFLAALVRENRDYGLQQLLFVATHRQLQRDAVREALLEIARDDLKCATLEDFNRVPERLAWTTGTALELPDPLKTYLPNFERVAQHVAQAQLVTSPFRRREALETSLAELRNLQLGLATTFEKQAIALDLAYLRSLFFGLYRKLLLRVEYLKVASEWEALLRAERDKAAALVTAELLPNPFVFGPPVKETEDQRFTGRRDVLQEIERALLGSETVPTLLLLGARRMGKSSLLNQLPRLLGPDCAPAVVDAQGANSNSLPGLAHAIAREVGEALRRRRVEPPPVDRAAFEREPLRALDDWVRAVESRLPGKLRVLLCVDEYERLEAAVQAGWGGSFLDQMRHILQHHPRFGLMFTGAKPLRSLGPAWTDRFISVSPLRVSFLREEDMRPLLTKPIPEFDLDYRPGALERLMDLTRGQPFLTQCVAYELVDRLNAANRKYADPADVDAAATKALETGDAYFANLWSDAGPDGQAALRALLATGTPPAPGPVRTLLRELEILTDEGQFAVPLVRRWVEAEIARA